MTTAKKRGGRKKGVSPKSAGEWKPVFLQALSVLPVIVTACRKAGISRAVAYREKDKDKTFRDAWKEAMEDGLDLTLASLHKRAREKSDLAAIFILKAHRRETYGDKVEHLGAGENNEIEIKLNIPPPPHKASLVKRLLTSKKDET
jgi:hypothetical protein